MNPEKRDRIRRRLQEQREELLAEIREKNSEAARILDEGVPDYGDLALADGLREYLHLLGDSKRDLLLEVDDALNRMDRGGFGECADCGAPIAEERLAVQPSSRFCVDCQRQREDAARRRAGPGTGKL